MGTAAAAEVDESPTAMTVPPGRRAANAWAMVTGLPTASTATSAPPPVRAWSVPTSSSAGPGRRRRRRWRPSSAPGSSLSRATSTTTIGAAPTSVGAHHHRQTDRPRPGPASGGRRPSLAGATFTTAPTPVTTAQPQWRRWWPGCPPVGGRPARRDTTGTPRNRRRPGNGGPPPRPGAGGWSRPSSHHCRACTRPYTHITGRPVTQYSTGRSGPPGEATRWAGATSSTPHRPFHHAGALVAEDGWQGAGDVARHVVELVWHTPRPHPHKQFTGVGRPRSRSSISSGRPGARRTAALHDGRREPEGRRAGDGTSRANRSPAWDARAVRPRSARPCRRDVESGHPGPPKATLET